MKCACCADLAVVVVFLAAVVLAAVVFAAVVFGAGFLAVVFVVVFLAGETPVSASTFSAMCPSGSTRVAGLAFA